MREKINTFLKNRKGQDLSNRIINLVVAGLILFSLFGTMYTQYIAGNTSMTNTCGPYGNWSCPSTHTLTYPIIITLLIIGLVIMIWRSARGKR